MQSKQAGDEGEEKSKDRPAEEGGEQQPQEGEPLNEPVGEEGTKKEADQKK